MIDATPDFSLQLNTLTMEQKGVFKGVFLTHAHIGHYTGLIHLGARSYGCKRDFQYMRCQKWKIF